MFFICAHCDNAVAYAGLNQKCDRCRNKTWLPVLSGVLGVKNKRDVVWQTTQNILWEGI